MIRAHSYALVLALLVGAIYAAPDVYHLASDGYQGVTMVGASDADFYLTVINKSYTSEGVVRDPFHYESRDAGNPFQYFLIEFVLGKAGALLHLPLDILVAATGFIFTALLTILFYVFGYYLSRSRLTAFVVAATMMLGTELVHPNGLTNLINTFFFHGTFNEFLLYSRPVNPQVSALFFFGALLALYNLLINPRSARAIILAGLGVGLLTYIYPYFWLFAFIASGVLALYALITRHFVLFASTCLAGVVTALTMAPFVYMNIPVFMHGGGSLTQAIPVHRIIVEKVILVPLFIYTLIFLWGWYAREKGAIGAWAYQFSQKYVFVLLLLVTGVMVSNHQVIDGRLFYQQHFHFFTNIPMFVLAMVVLASDVLMRVPKLWRIAAVGVLIAVPTWFALGVQVASYKAHSGESARYQTLAPVYAYLRSQGPDKVVLTDYALATSIPMNTEDYTYSGGYDNVFAISPEQLRHDYFVILALRGVTTANIRSYLYDHRNEVGGTLFIGTYWRDLCGTYTCFPDSILDDLVPQFQTFMKQPLLQQIHQHKVDYVLWDRALDPKWRLKNIVTEPPVIENGDFALYPIQH